ncbi:hypothetical protein PHMEG_0001488 [Phytophthora megakarya]|uniref:Uncharacterized protein n=1 Tax=Phytophthora megakarya TaxID=4795 RepID=A0A225X0G8_9STRA|nr:hypothetical protein PHMEG_0001488 [Phytophthora megakarya]
MAVDPYSIFVRAFWEPIKAKEYAESELLKLCRETTGKHYLRYFWQPIFTMLFSTLAGKMGPLPDSLMKHMGLLFESDRLIRRWMLRLIAQTLLVAEQ